METAAIPLLSAILFSCPKERAPLNGLIIRKERKTTGRGRAIEGDLTQAPIVLIDDILNSGESAEKARVVLEAVGRKIDEMFVVIDYRSSRGADWRKAHGVAVHSLFTLPEFGLELRKDPPRPPQHYRQLWRAAVPGGFPFYVVPKSTPLLVGDVIYRGCDAGKMHAFFGGHRSDPVGISGDRRRAAQGHLVLTRPSRRPALFRGLQWCGLLPRRQDRRGGMDAILRRMGRRLADQWSPSMGSSISASNMSGPGRKAISARSTCAPARKSGSGSTKKFQHGSPAYSRGGDLVIWGTADHEMAAYRCEIRQGRMGVPDAALGEICPGRR